MSIISKLAETLTTHLTKTKHKEQEQSPTTGEKTHNKAYSNQVAVNEPIDNTPFRLVGNKDEGYAISLGLHLLTDKQPTIEEAIQQLETHKWNIITNMMLTIPKVLTELNNLITHENQQK